MNPIAGGMVLMLSVAAAGQQIAVPRAVTEYARVQSSYSGGVTDLALGELYPYVFKPAPPDVQAIFSAMQARGPVSPEAWSIVEQAYADFHALIEAILPQLDDFEKQYPGQYFLNYPPVKPRESRALYREMLLAVHNASDQMSRELADANRDLQDAGIEAVAFMFRRDANQRLARMSLGIPLARTPDLSFIIQKVCKPPLARDVDHLLYEWEEQSSRQLLACYETLSDCLNDWQTTLQRRGLPEPPHKSEDWDPQVRAESIEIYRQTLKPVHRLGIDRLRQTLAMLERVLPHLEADEARYVRVFFGQQLLQFRSHKTIWPLRVYAEIKGLKSPSQAEADLIAAWDQRDLSMLRELVMIAAQNPEPVWVYHHRIDPMKPVLAAKFDDLIDKRDKAAETLSREVCGMRGVSELPKAAMPDYSNAVRRKPLTQLLKLPDQVGLGHSDWAIRSGPGPLDEQWVKTMNELLGPGVAEAVNVVRLAELVEDARIEAVKLIQAHPDRSWGFSSSGYKFSEARNNENRLVRQEARRMIADAERVLVDRIEAAQVAAREPGAVCLRVLARRANANRMIEADRIALAPGDSAAMIEPLTALIAVRLDREAERAVWDEIHGDAEAFVESRCAWRSDLVEPALDRYAAANSLVWASKDPRGIERLRRATMAVQAVHEQYARNVGDAALHLANRIHQLLRKEDAAVFKHRIRMQASPGVWGFEPSALTQLRMRCEAAVDTATHTALEAFRDEAIAAEEAIALQLEAILAPADALPESKTPTDAQVRILSARRIETAETFLARALAAISNQSDAG